MNDKYLRKDITAVVVDEHGYPKTTTYDEEAVELENRVEVMDKEVVKLKAELEIAQVNKLFSWKNVLMFTLSVILGLAFLASCYYLYISSGAWKCLLSSMFLCVIFVLSLSYLSENRPYYTNGQIKKLEAKLEVAEEMKEERQRELEEYLKNMKALEPVLEETVVDLSGEYQIDIENVREELEREAISRTRKREKRGR